MSYGSSASYMYRQAGVYVGQIFQAGQARGFTGSAAGQIRTGVNHNTAKLLGLAVPQSLQVAADDVI